jgi:hypothetical protein
MAGHTVALNHIEHSFACDNQFQIAEKNGDLLTRTKERGSELDSEEVGTLINFVTPFSLRVDIDEALTRAALIMEQGGKEDRREQNRPEWLLRSSQSVPITSAWDSVKLRFDFDVLCYGETLGSPLARNPSLASLTSLSVRQAILLYIDVRPGSRKRIPIRSRPREGMGDEK